jgi:hypothetical protein
MIFVIKEKTKFIYKAFKIISEVFFFCKLKISPEKRRNQKHYILLKDKNSYYYHSDATIERDLILVSLALISSNVVVLSVITSI